MFLSDVKKIINERGYISVSDFKDYKDFTSFCSDHKITTNPLLSPKPKIKDESECLCPVCGGFQKLLTILYTSSVIKTERNTSFVLRSCSNCMGKGKVGWTERIVRK